MKKIPTIFVRDMSSQPALVTPEITAGCEWVFAGEGMPTVKIDGTCCMVRDGCLYKRREVRRGKPDPDGFELSEEDPNTGKRFGWVAVSDCPEDRYHLEAWERQGALADGSFHGAGTYELVGPKVQRGLYGDNVHRLLLHGNMGWPEFERTYDCIRATLNEMADEGIVWHHPDGRMAKIKRRDFGLPWPIKAGA